EILSRGKEAMYIFERRSTRGGAVVRGIFILVLMLCTDCSLFTLKSAHSSRLLPKAKGETRASSSWVMVSPLARSCSMIRDIWTVFHTNAALESRLRHVALFMISS